MWMMGYNDGGELSLHDSFNATARKLRPLIPRPLQPSANTSSHTTATIPSPPYSSRNSHDFFAQYHHLGIILCIINLLYPFINRMYF